MEGSAQDELLSALEADYTNAPVGTSDRVMLAYSAKLTRTPCQIDASDIAALRSAGFDDRGIHDICAIVAYFAFVNRIADGLGVELET
jgi:uncharacterized peroxidase-related enzyme